MCLSLCGVKSATALASRPPPTSPSHTPHRSPLLLLSSGRRLRPAEHFFRGCRVPGLEPCGGRQEGLAGGGPRGFDPPPLPISHPSQLGPVARHRRVSGTDLALRRRAVDRARVVHERRPTIGWEVGQLCAGTFRPRDSTTRPQDRTPRLPLSAPNCARRIISPLRLRVPFVFDLKCVFYLKSARAPSESL